MSKTARYAAGLYKSVTNRKTGNASVCRWIVLRNRRTLLTGGILLVVACLPLRADVILTEGAGFGVDVSPADGSIAMDLMGSIWTLPANGGQARQLTDGLISVTAPRWSPDGATILYQLRAVDGSEIWQLEINTADTERISNTEYHDQDASWHPQGERIVYASERNDSGLDIWETDLPTGLSWRRSKRRLGRWASSSISAS